MEDEKTMYPYFPEWKPTGDYCNDVAKNGTIVEGEYYG